MTKHREIGLRSFLVLLLVATTLVTFVIVGAGTLLVRLPQISRDNQELVERAADDMSSRVEVYLQHLEGRLKGVGQAATGLSSRKVSEAIATARGDVFHAVYIVDRFGQIVANTVRDIAPEISDEMVGTDMLSSNRLFMTAKSTGQSVWSDKFLSAVTGTVTIGVAVPIAANGSVVVAELPLSQLLQISIAAAGFGHLDFWVIDRKGEVVADTGAVSASRLNLYNLPIVSAGLNGQPVPKSVTFDNRNYQAFASLSTSLGWLFVGRIPAGLDNGEIRQTIAIVLVGFAGSVLVGLMLAPFWASAISRPMAAITDQARRVASGSTPNSWPKASVAEFNQLSSDLKAMADAILRREEDLRMLNEELETRVENRTSDLASANTELSTTLDSLHRAQKELVQSEKHAALGRLVAGVAHELNTPLSNSRMAVTIMRDRITRLRDKIKGDLSRTELDSFMSTADSCSALAEDNINRVADLVANFKQVATDRSTASRQRFELSHIIGDTLIPPSPENDRTGAKCDFIIPKNLEMDSYPKELTEVLSNLVENAFNHAFNDTDQNGEIRVAAKLECADMVCVTVDDNGIGMSTSVASKIFDPFYRSRMGGDGTGLGLHITRNVVENILGGHIEVSSKEGIGTQFTLRLPLTAPEANIN